MRIRNKKMLLAAAILLLLAAVAGIFIFDRDSGIDFERKLELAEEYLESSDYDNAIAIYNGIIAEDDGCSEAYVGLAEAYYTKGNTEKALSVLEKGLEYSADEDIVIERIKTFFPDYFGYENDEYYAEVPDEIDFETENYEDTASETEITDAAEETAVTETTAVPDTEETTVTTTEEITTAAAPIVTTTAATTTVPITTTASTAASVTTTAAPRTTAELTSTTTAAEIKEPEAVIVDDLTMMTASEAAAWCESNNLSLSVIGGDGKIISQSPAPGSIIEEYSEIIVRCE